MIINPDKTVAERHSMKNVVLPRGLHTVFRGITAEESKK